MIQPLDQGIIATLKCNYRHELLMKLVNERTTISECLKTINVKEVIYLAGKAWDRVTAKCIEACWNRGLGTAFSGFEGFDADDLASAEQRLVEFNEFEGFDADDLASAEQRLEEYIRSNVSEPERVLEIEPSEVNEWIQTENDCNTYGTLSDSEIIDGVLNKNQCGTEPDDDEDDDIETGMPPSAKEALEGLEIGLRWLETQDVDTIRVLHLRNIVDFAKSKKASALKQKSVLDYFKKK